MLIMPVSALVKTDVPFVTSLGVGAHLQAWGVPAERIFELDWWQTWRFPTGQLEITAAPSQHFSGGGLKDGSTTLWSSLVIRTPGHSVFFSGDIGLTPEYAAIRAAFRPFDLVMLEVEALNPSWGHIHLRPANALQALDLLDGGAFLPVHWCTFSLSTHAWDEPAATLFELAPAHSGQLNMARLGEAVEPAHAECVTPWWRAVDAVAVKAPAAEPVAETLPTSLPWPLD